MKLMKMSQKKKVIYYRKMRGKRIVVKKVKSEVIVINQVMQIEGDN